MSVSETAGARRVPALSNLALVVFGLLVGVIAGEVLLAALDLPRTHRPRSFPDQFLFWPLSDNGATVFVNYPDPQGIEFVYDSNPRGYFSNGNSLTHRVNRWGFRDVRGEQSASKSVEHTPSGAIFHGLETKAPGRVRLLFLGDSLTFGEGVRDDDVYPRATAEALNHRIPDLRLPSDASFEAINMGVSGYNTRQSLYALRHWGTQFSPDIVILGYSLNDTEGPLWLANPAGGRPRRDNARDLPMGIANTQGPPDTGLFRSRILRVLWHAGHTRTRTQTTIDYYRYLHGPDNPYFESNMAALDEVVSSCREHGIPCVVVCFPVLYRLDDAYPFSDVHEALRERVESRGGLFIDMLDELKGRDATELWVHPSDPHPNDQVHAAAVEALVRLFLAGTIPLPV